MRRIAPAARPLAAMLLAGCAATGGGASAEATDSAEVITVQVGETDAGPSLVGPDGRTLYVFTPDTDGTSTCYDDCADAWPPLAVPEGGSVQPGDGVPGELGIAERDDGTSQVTYEGMPLHYFASDAGPGDAAGHGVNDVWFVAAPEGQSGLPSESAAPSESAEPSDHDGHEPSPTADDDYGY